MTKQDWIDVAEVVDAMRIFPRVWVAVYYVAYLILLFESFRWFWEMTHINTDWAKIAAASAFPALLLTALGGVLAKLTDDYFNSGRDWSKK